MVYGASTVITASKLLEELIKVEFPDEQSEACASYYALPIRVLGSEVSPSTRLHHLRMSQNTLVPLDTYYTMALGMQHQPGRLLDVTDAKLTSALSPGDFHSLRVRLAMTMKGHLDHHGAVSALFERGSWGMTTNRIGEEWKCDLLRPLRRIR